MGSKNVAHAQFVAKVGPHIEQKVEILDKIGGKSYKLLSEEYGVGISTISGGRVLNLRDYKRKMAEMGCKRPAKTMRMGHIYTEDKRTS